MSLDELYRCAVLPFPHRDRREFLYRQLCAFLEEVQTLGLRGEWWIDGSFLSEKPAPSDIDMVLFWNPSCEAGIGPQSQARLTELFDQGAAKTSLNCDAYAEPSGDEQREFYWRGVLGFDGLKRPKGVVVFKS